MIKIDKKENCCGCTACMNICPQKAIEMKQDNEGFLYPEVDLEKCVNCNLCEKVCPVIAKKKVEEFSRKAYVIQNKNINERLESTSGGGFSPIAKYVLKKNGIVFGAILGENNEVYHTWIEKEEDLYQLRGSKYVQSNLKMVYSDVLRFLKEDRWVCFSGTPCQIQGLKKFLQKDYTKLVTVDFVCRAVPSPLVLKKYLEYEKNKNKFEKIDKVIFRDKEKYGYNYSTMTLKNENNKYQMGVESDPYLRAFFKNYSDRPSCYQCLFRDKERISDFTLWDCFTIELFNKKMDDNKGTTRMIVQSPMGKEIFEQIKDDYVYQEVEIEEITKNVRELKESVKPNENREQFFKDINEMETNEFFNKYFPDTIKVKLERNARRILVKMTFYNKLKNVIKKIIKKG